MKVLLKVTVTQEHVDRAIESNQPRDGRYCPIHQALVDLGYDRHISQNYIWAKNGQWDHHSDDTPLPESARAWIQAFDRQDEPELPFSFTVELQQ